MSAKLTSLCDRSPTLDAQSIVAGLIPPPQFENASFESYIPDPDYESQSAARDRLATFASTGGTLKTGLFSRSKKDDSGRPGVYLDGGFGVGKTHLLAAAWNASLGRKKFFGTFLQYTSLVGALGFVNAVEALRGASLICIDEFELDDPGDTMMMTRMLGELVAGGTRVAATSNTPPHALGEGRFAAADFLREIHALAANFDTLRIDGTDYRKRSIEGEASAQSTESLTLVVEAARVAGDTATLDSFDELLAHLATVHPSVYPRLISEVDLIALTNVHVIMNQTDALRLVAFIDRVYDAQIPLVASGVPISTVFGGDMINGGYRKKYLRCMSRLIALTNMT
ncbi:MAG: cell division protein ZapE [Microbacteriaceae bacterium]